MVKLTLLSYWSYRVRRRRTSDGGGGGGGVGAQRGYRECGASNTNYAQQRSSSGQSVLLDVFHVGGGGGGGGGVGSYDPSGCWLLFLLLLMFSNVSEECPTGCQCKWKSGKEIVSCFRASLNKIPMGLDPGTQVLNMSGNGIKSLPGHVFLSLNLLNLQKIYLSGCELVSLHPNVFNKLTNLVELDLSGNGLELIPSHTFSEIPELRELKVNSNPISRLSNDAFAPLRRLVRLELTNCQLGTIEPWAFRDLRSLEWLRLDGNRLRTVSADSFFPLQSLHGLKMNDNPWNCSCALKPLRDWMIKNNVPFEGVPPTCQQPARLGGKSWDRLQLYDFACLPKLEMSTEEERIRRVVEGHNTTFICRLFATADTHVSWLAGSRGVTLTNGSSWSVGGGGGGGGVMLSESFSWKAEDLEGKGDQDPESAGGGGNGGVLDRSLGIKISVLTVTRATARDAGLYTCRGESRAGSVATNFSLVVLQNKAENLTGRLLFTGTLVAALLTVLACLLLSCVCLVGRYRRTLTMAMSMRTSTGGTTTTNNTTASTVLNHHHHHNQNQQQQQQQQQHHQMDKIELNHFGGTINQNGGNGLLMMSSPSMQQQQQQQHHHHHNSSNQYNHHITANTTTTMAMASTTTTTTTTTTTNNLSCANSNMNANSNNNNSSLLIRRSTERITTRDYKALPTADPDDDEEEEDDGDLDGDGDCDSGDLLRNERSTSHSKKLTLNNSVGPEHLSGDDKHVNVSKLGHGITSSCSSSSDPIQNNSGPGPALPTSSHNFGFNIREQQRPHFQQQQQQQGGSSYRENNKFPDLLIDDKMSTSIMSSSSSNFVSLPRPNRNHDMYARSGYFHRRESQSPLLSSHNNSYDNSVDTLAYSSTTTTTTTPNTINSSMMPHHYQHHHGHHHSQQPQYHRLSMPSSPLHSGGGLDHDSQSSTSYDYHAAQLLEKFLEEYRVLQLELMQMSASLNQQQPNNQETNVNNLSHRSNDSMTPTHHSQNPQQQQQQQQQQHQQQQQQLKSILKTTHNNNYMS